VIRDPRRWPSYSTDVEAAERSVRCSRCKAEPGEPCKTPSGTQAGVHHVARYFAARRTAEQARRGA